LHKLFFLPAHDTDETSAAIEFANTATSVAFGAVTVTVVTVVSVVVPAAFVVVTVETVSVVVVTVGVRAVRSSACVAASSAVATILFLVRSQFARSSSSRPRTATLSPPSVFLYPMCRGFLCARSRSASPAPKRKKAADC